MNGKSKSVEQRLEQVEQELARIRSLYERTLRYRDSDPVTALMHARKAAEVICHQLFCETINPNPGTLMLDGYIEKLQAAGALPKTISVPLRTIQFYGNLATHYQGLGTAENLTVAYIQPCLQALAVVVDWYFTEHGRGAPGGRGAVNRQPVLPGTDLLDTPTPTSTTRRVDAREVPATGANLGAVPGRSLGAREVQQRDSVTQSADSSAPDTPGHLPQTNIPTQVTSFIGRKQDLAEVLAALRTHAVRLLTITGTGGCGKTRLALAAASELVGEYQDGVWLVELAALALSQSAPQPVIQAVATVLNIREEPTRPLLDTATEQLQSRHMLLVMDNCEHLIEPCAELISGLLRRCAHVRFLVTSREALNIQGEKIWRVPSLAVPSIDHGLSYDLAGHFAAIQLFLERAMAQRADFTLTTENMPAVVQICRRLDGIPLAIELAAARVQVLAAEEIADRLLDRFQLLTGGPRTTLPRHQTLQATLDWSYALLGQLERMMLQRLAVFAGGWTLEAAEVVCAGEEIADADVLDLLTQLEAKSLLQVTRYGNQTRYSMLETVRQYAVEKLKRSGESTSVQQRHAAYFAALSEKAESHRSGVELPAWIDRLQVEIDNLRRALTWTMSDPSCAELGLRLSLAVGWLLTVRGYHSEVRRWFDSALAGQGSASARIRAQVLMEAGYTARHQSDYAAAAALLQESLLMWQDIGDLQGLADAHDNLGTLFREQGDYEKATAELETSLLLRKELGDRQSLGRTFNSLGSTAYYQGHFARATVLLFEGLSLFQEIGDMDYGAYCLMRLGSVSILQGNPEQASAYLEESLALFRKQESSWGIAAATKELGAVSGLRGNHQQAQRLYAESLTMFFQQLHKRGVMECLEGLAVVEAQRGRSNRAARLFGAAQALRLANGIALPPAFRDAYEPHLRAVRADLGEEAFTVAFAGGEKMTLEQATAYALDEVEQPTTTP